MFTVHAFKADYAYTPSKLPSSVAMHLNGRQTEETDHSWETVTKPMSSMSVSASDARPNGSLDHGIGSLNHVELATTVQQTSSVSSGEGFGTIVVYSRRGDSLNGSTSLNEGAATAAGCFTPSGIRRSCSLDGVALASRCHGDDDLIGQRGGVRRTKTVSFDDDWHSQGDADRMSSADFLPLSRYRLWRDGQIP